jgi:D-aminoacyl-tRNA deacylase
MRVVLQRVSNASVSVDRELLAEIGHGVVLLVGITPADTSAQVAWMAKKIATLRIFPALNGPSGFDRTLVDVGGAVLVVSQFTLYGDTSGGRRPSFIAAARPEQAAPLIDAFVEQLRGQQLSVQTGRFGADMQVALINDGPLTLSLEC